MLAEKRRGRPKLDDNALVDTILCLTFGEATWLNHYFCGLRFCHYGFDGSEMVSIQKRIHDDLGVLRVLETLARPS